MMAKPKLTMPAATAYGLSVRERILLFCAASGTDWQHAGVTGEMVTAMAVKGLIERDAAARHLTLTERGRCCRTYDAQPRVIGNNFDLEKPKQ
jgi:hypothetical protein